MNRATRKHERDARAELMEEIEGAMGADGGEIPCGFCGKPPERCNGGGFDEYEAHDYTPAEIDPALAREARAVVETIPEWVIYCQECGSLDVQTCEWIAPNTREIHGDDALELDGGHGNTFCAACASAGADPNPILCYSGNLGPEERDALALLLACQGPERVEEWRELSARLRWRAGYDPEPEGGVYSLASWSPDGEWQDEGAAFSLAGLETVCLLDDDEMAAIAALPVGGEHMIGGGAAVRFRVYRAG